jgi:ribosomal silencing factor RsfS
MESFFDNEHRNGIHMQSVAANISAEQEMSHKKKLRSEIRKSQEWSVVGKY